MKNEKDKESGSKKTNVHTGHRARMRAKVTNDPDFNNMLPHEMLEFLLFFGVTRKDTNEIAHNLIRHFGSFSKVFFASADEIELAAKGLSEQAAHTVASVMPIARWVEAHRNKPEASAQLNTSKQIFDALKGYFLGRITENVYALGLDVSNKLIQIWHVATGIANFSKIDVSKIVLTASRIGASKVVLAHNHPGGNLYPSIDDIVATQKVALSLGTLGMMLLDHIIIVNQNEFFSFNDTGALLEILQDLDTRNNSTMVAENLSLFNATEMLKLQKSRKKSDSVLELCKSISKKINAEVLDFEE